MKLIYSGQRRKLVGVLAGLPFFIASQAAWAHVGQVHSHTEAWTVWTLTPDIEIPTVLVCLVYVTGIIRRRAFDSLQLWRHAAFLGGVLSVFLALASPIDYVAEHVFYLHQVQHLLLHMIGPMLIALSAPQAMLISGLPSALRRKALVPTVSNSTTRQSFSRLTNPVVVTALYIASLYVWQYPPYHDAAILSEPIHYVMHVSMLVAGLLFWWRIFDVRAAPVGLTYGARLMMLWIVILSNIALGSYTTLKSEIIYPAYDTVGRLFQIRPLFDEMLGGLIIWIPSSMMCLVGMIIVIHMWGRQETRAEERGFSSWLAGGSSRPTTGAALVDGARAKNHALAAGVAVFAIVVFATVLSIGVLNHMNGAEPHGLFVAGPSRSETSVQ